MPNNGTLTIVGIGSIFLMLERFESDQPIRYAGVVPKALQRGSKTLVGNFSISLLSYLYIVALFLPISSASLSTVMFFSSRNFLMRSPIVIYNTFFQYIVIDIMQNKLYYNGVRKQL